MSSIYFLHLSDLHIDKESFLEAKYMTTNLCQKIKEFFEHKKIDKLDFIVVSGDLVNKGSDSYDLVEIILQEIRSAANVKNDRIFIVPGNHDLNQERYVLESMKDSIEELKKEPKLISKLEDKYYDLLSPLFERYTLFAKKFSSLTGDEASVYKLPGFFNYKFEVDKLTINVCGLNNALVAGPDDYKKEGDPKDALKLDNRCCVLHYLYEMLKGAHNMLNVVIFHYPLTLVHSSERSNIERLLNENKAILLTGHTHEPSEEATGLINPQLLKIGTGASYGRKWGGKNSCRIVELPSHLDNAILHDYIYFIGSGWRRFYPMKAHCGGWILSRKLVEPDKYKEKIVSEVRAFYPDRRHLPPLDHFLKPAQKEIFWIGNIATFLIGNVWNILVEKAAVGCSVKLLLMNPNVGTKKAPKTNPLLSPIEYITDHRRAEKSLDANLATIKSRLQDLKKLNINAYQKIEVKLYTTLVTMVIFFIDANPNERTDSSRIHIELLPHKFVGSERPSFELDLTTEHSLSINLYNKYKELWVKGSKNLARF